MPDRAHAQAVIIGGGVGGCGLAYHLTLMGLTVERFGVEIDAVVEKEPLYDPRREKVRA